MGLNDPVMRPSSIILIVDMPDGSQGKFIVDHPAKFDMLFEKADLPDIEGSGFTAWKIPGPIPQGTLHFKVEFKSDTKLRTSIINL